MDQDTARQQVQQEIATDGTHMGTLIWTDFDGVHVRRQDVRDALDAEGLPMTLIGEDVTPRKAFGAAVRDYRDADDGYRLDRPEKRARQVRILRATDADPLTPYRTCGTLDVDDQGAILVDRTSEWDPGAEGVLAKVQALYDRHRFYADSTEVSSMITSALLGWFAGCRLSKHGKVYWVPEPSTQRLLALCRVAEGIPGCSPFPVPIHRSSAMMSSIRNGAARDFTSRIKRLEEELEQFAVSETTTRASTFEKRLEAFEDLREQVDLYADILDAKRGKLLAMLDTASDRARELLSDIDSAAA